MRSTMFSTTVSPLLRRVLAVSVLGIGVLGLTACAVGSTAEPSETAAAPAAAPAAAQSVQSLHAAGPGGFFLNAVNSVDLRADQTATVANLRATLAAQTAPVQAAHAALRAELAQQVRSGVLDSTRTQPLLDNVTAAITATRPAVQQAVQQLHDTLDADQRQALVDALPTRGNHEGHVARRAQMKARMDKIATELSLTDDQRTAIHDQMRAAFEAHKDTFKGNHSQMKDRFTALTTSFTTDTFDATALGVGEHGAAMANHFGGMHGAFLAAAVPVLTATQRNILATKILSRTQAIATTAKTAAVEPSEAVDAVEE
jgi:LTXXQ motif family protein